MSKTPVAIRIEKKPEICFKKPFLDASNTYFRLVKNAKSTDKNHAKAVEIAVENSSFESKKYAKKLTKVVAIPNTI